MKTNFPTFGWKALKKIDSFREIKKDKENELWM